MTPPKTPIKCTNCGKTFKRGRHVIFFHGKRLCGNCKKNGSTAKEWIMEMREVAISLGNCRYCFNEPADPFHKSCIKCREYHNRKSNEYYHRVFGEPK